ncbi:hypothetical protein Tco_1315736 [Tanacetum coccineum]
MEDEFYHLTVKGKDLKTYVRRFQELATLCPTMVPDSKQMMEVFIRGFPRSTKILINEGLNDNSSDTSVHAALRELLLYMGDITKETLGDITQRDIGRYYHRVAERYYPNEILEIIGRYYPNRYFMLGHMGDDVESLGAVLERLWCKVEVDGGGFGSCGVRG